MNDNKGVFKGKLSINSKKSADPVEDLCKGFSQMTSVYIHQLFSSDSKSNSMLGRIPDISIMMLSSAATPPQSTISSPNTSPPSQTYSLNTSPIVSRSILSMMQSIAPTGGTKR